MKGSTVHGALRLAQGPSAVSTMHDINNKIEQKTLLL